MWAFRSVLRPKAKKIFNQVRESDKQLIKPSPHLTASQITFFGVLREGVQVFSFSDVPEGIELEDDGAKLPR